MLIYFYIYFQAFDSEPSGISVCLLCSISLEIHCNVFHFEVNTVTSPLVFQNKCDKIFQACFRAWIQLIHSLHQLKRLIWGSLQFNNSQQSQRFFNNLEVQCPIQCSWEGNCSEDYVHNFCIQFHIFQHRFKTKFCCK